MPIKSRDALILWAMGALLVLGISLSAHASQGQPRLITLAPHLTELAFEAGADQHLVGVVDFSDYPQQAQTLPRIGDAFRFDLEAIVRLQPTHALAWSGGTPTRVANQLTTLGMTVVWIETNTLTDIPRAIETLARLGGDPVKASQAIKHFHETLAMTASSQKAVAATEPVRIFYQISRQPLYTFGAGHVINEVFSMCGARNVFQDVEAQALVVDPETVIDRAPEIILVGNDAQTDHGERGHFLNELMASEQPSHAIPIHYVDANLLVRPTSRILTGIQTLCALIETTSSGSAL